MERCCAAKHQLKDNVSHEHKRETKLEREVMDANLADDRHRKNQ
jgi:hypothetical protein